MSTSGCERWLYLGFLETREDGVPHLPMWSGNDAERELLEEEKQLAALKSARGSKRKAGLDADADALKEGEKPNKCKKTLHRPPKAHWT